MARTAATGIGKKTLKNISAKKSIISSQPRSSPSKSQKTIPSQSNVARKKSQSVKTPKIVVPVGDDSIKRKTRKRSLVMKEIHFFQQSSDMLMNKLPFVRMIKNVADTVSTRHIIKRFTRTSLLALQEAFEAYVVSLLEDSNLCARHAKRITLFPNDINLVKKLGIKGGRYYN